MLVKLLFEIALSRILNRSGVENLLNNDTEVRNV
jgi:hypothetical protein